MTLGGRVNPEVIITLISAALALMGALAAGVTASRSARQSHELERRRRLETQAEAAERIFHQYRDPLLDAAHTLQGRIFNIVRQNYFGRYLHCGDPDEERYARNYTLYAIGEYLCWVEIVRREVRFLDLGDMEDPSGSERRHIERNRKLLDHLTQLQYVLQKDIPSPFVIFRGRQRAIAELMMVPTNAVDGPRTECMGYAAFDRRLDADPEFAAWFARLSEDIDVVARSTDAENIRLFHLQVRLIDLIDFLDPKAVRIPRDFRARLPEPAHDPQHEATGATSRTRPPVPLTRPRSA
jgi:hypothetical protein